MADKREQILARLRVIIEGVPGLSLSPEGELRGVGRNRGSLSSTARPAIILHDGGEEEENTTLTGADRRTGPRRSAQQKMRMHPQFEILLGQPTEEVGTLASTLRARLLPLLFADEPLIELLGGPYGSGDIHYDGLEFETIAGEQREARAVVHVSLTYVFKLSDLAA